MYTLVIRLRGSNRAWVSPRKKPLKDMVQHVFLTEGQELFNGWAWRLHDGSGWADGTAMAWRDIPELPETATVIY